MTVQVTMAPWDLGATGLTAGDPCAPKTVVAHTAAAVTNAGWNGVAVTTAAAVTVWNAGAVTAAATLAATVNRVAAIA